MILIASLLSQSATAFIRALHWRNVRFQPCAARQFAGNSLSYAEKEQSPAQVHDIAGKPLCSRAKRGRAGITQPTCCSDSIYRAIKYAAINVR